MTTPAGTPAPSPRRYAIGDTIPTHGVVIAIHATAYEVAGNGGFAWVPFYGERGVDPTGTVEGLVTFADGSRYGGR